jgi:hypothetical protein
MTIRITTNSIPPPHSDKIVPIAARDGRRAIQAR